MPLPWGSSFGGQHPQAALPQGKWRAGGLASYMRKPVSDKAEKDEVAVTWCHYEPLDPLIPDLHRTGAI